MSTRFEIEKGSKETSNNLNTTGNNLFYKNTTFTNSPLSKDELIVSCKRENKKSMRLSRNSSKQFTMVQLTIISTTCWDCWKNKHLPQHPLINNIEDSFMSVLLTYLRKNDSGNMFYYSLVHAVWMQVPCDLGVRWLPKKCNHLTKAYSACQSRL